MDDLSVDHRSSDYGTADDRRRFSRLDRAVGSNQSEKTVVDAKNLSVPRVANLCGPLSHHIQHGLNIGR
jgi:hypothetical protein